MVGSEFLDPKGSRPSQTGDRAGYAVVGVLAGPVLGLVFFVARIGPAGLIWWEGPGGETILIPLGQFVYRMIIAVGALAGLLCGLALVATYHPEPRATKPTSDTPQEHLWDRELDG
jgi:hypothetical protein